MPNALNKKTLAYTNLPFFLIYEQTIYYWLKNNGKFLQKRGRKEKVNQKSVSLLRDYVDKNKTLTQQVMADYLSQQVGQRISRQAIGWWLKKLGITRKKKLTYHYTELDEVKAKAFNEEIKFLLPNFPFIALDECSFYPKLDPRFGYSLKGERAVEKRLGHKGKHCTLLFAMGNLKKSGVVHWELTKERVN